MDPRLLDYYHNELQHIRKMAGEFADAYPNIAGRLTLKKDDNLCPDPYVERLLEGFAYLSARVQVKLDASFPRFTAHLLEIVYPHYLAPTPSMTVVQFQPDLTEGSYLIPKATPLRSELAKGEETACLYRTAHDVTLWPLELTEVEYLAGSSTIEKMGVPVLPNTKAAIRLRLKSTVKFNELKNLDELSFYLRGAGDLPMRLYEQLLANSIGVVVQSIKRPLIWQHVIKHNAVIAQGFDENEALLPYTPRSFQGYRLLQEYFAFPQRYLFVKLTQLQSAMQQCDDKELEIIILLNNSHQNLNEVVDKSQFALFCTPAINLFPKRAESIRLSNETHEYHVVPERTRPLDYEIYQLTEVTARGGSDEKQDFLPFYQVGADTRQQRAYYSINREPRVVSSKRKLQGTRLEYTGNEFFISLVDSQEAPFNSDLRLLEIETLCTNRDLPLQLPTGLGETDFNLQSGAPVKKSIRCLSEPTKPRPSAAHKDVAWKLINHLSLNYLTLINNNEQDGAVALRQLLSLYADNNEISQRRQIEGIVSIQSRPIVRRIEIAKSDNREKHIVFGRGLEIIITVEETAFEGTGVFLLGMVLEQFFAHYVSINSFTETVLESIARGEIKRWPMRIGQRHLT